MIGRLPFGDRPVLRFGVAASGRVAAAYDGCAVRAVYASWAVALMVHGSDLLLPAVSVRVAPGSRPLAGGRGDQISTGSANRPPSKTS